MGERTWSLGQCTRVLPLGLFVFNEGINLMGVWPFVRRLCAAPGVVFNEFIDLMWGRAVYTIWQGGRHGVQARAEAVPRRDSLQHGVAVVHLSRTLRRRPKKTGPVLHCLYNEKERSVLPTL